MAVLLLGSSLFLSGCVASLAASAVGAAVRGAQPKPASNEHLKPVASEACSAHASQYGTVHVIDVQQSSPSKIIVWGTATQGTDRQSFECTYTTKIAGFKLRPIRS